MERNRKCLYCGKELIGKQRKYCSSRCRNSYCSEYDKKYNKEYRKRNRDNMRQQKKLYREKNKAKIKEWFKIYREHNREILNESNKEYYRDNKKEILLQSKKYYQDNKEKIKERARKYYQRSEVKEKRKEHNKKYKKEHKYQINKLQREKRKKYPMFKLNNNMSRCIRSSLKKNNLSKKGIHWEYLVGYAIQDLKRHLESLFIKGMNWENHSKNGWHIDHVIPISFFKFKNTDDVEFKYCWSLNNLQPLWAEENWKKNKCLVNK